MRVLAVAGEQDHRLRPGVQQQRYWVDKPGWPSALEAVFQQLSPNDPGSDQPLQLGSRRIGVLRRSTHAIWCRFADLCEQPLAAMDFMALCDRFPAILISAIPALGRGRPRRGRGSPVADAGAEG
ncbi:hypothetical protein WR25_26312 [Diploscapter pachys]|uniref:Uncharacterized protein n=1 Tax=Diploscapter pachys TaxID=2018661 RepID=A0A2A2M516_9BILA|nr:hypothetical protein WR25_26312 [Diploscapter pachys]